MKSAERQALRDVAMAAMAGTRERADVQHSGLPPGALDWQLQTSNSFRRVGTTYGDGDVLCGTKHPRDGQPDLHGASGVLDYIVAAQPSAVLALLDELDRCEEALAMSRKQHQEDHAELARLKTEAQR